MDINQNKLQKKQESDTAMIFKIMEWENPTFF